MVNKINNYKNIHRSYRDRRVESHLNTYKPLGISDVYYCLKGQIYKGTKSGKGHNSLIKGPWPTSLPLYPSISIIEFIPEKFANIQIWASCLRILLKCIKSVSAQVCA